MGAGQLLNGLAGPVTQAAPTLVSSTWFPSEQRTTSTAVAALCGSLGVAISFLIGPLVVKDIKCELDSMRPDRGNLTKNMRLVLLTFILVWFVCYSLHEIAGKGKRQTIFKTLKYDPGKGWELTSCLKIPRFTP